MSLAQYDKIKSSIYIPICGMDTFSAKHIDVYIDTDSIDMFMYSPLLNFSSLSSCIPMSIV